MKTKDKKTNGELLFADNPELLLDTICGFDCDHCACQADCPPGTLWYSDKCKLFKFEWLSDWYEWPYKKSKRKVTEKEKIMKAATKKKSGRKKAVRCVESGMEYISASDAEEKLGISEGCIGKCCRGERKSAGGFHWEFA